MELVYLWHDYDTTIQCANEFNFGSRYKFHFTNDEYLEVEENSSYIENLYSENISVSAIVGSNGVGKSQLLKLIWNGITHERYFAVVLINNKFQLINAKYNDSLELPLSNKEGGILIERMDIKIIDDDRLPLSNTTSYFFTNETICYDTIEENLTIANHRMFSSNECSTKRSIDNSSKSIFQIVHQMKNIRNMIVHKAENQAEIDSKIIELYNNLETEIISYEKMKFSNESDVFERAIEIIYDNDIPWYDDMKKPDSVQIGIDSNKFNSFIKNSKIPKGLLDINSSISEKILIYYSLSWFLDFQKDVNAPSEIKEKYSSIFQDFFYEKKKILHNVDNFFEKLQKEYFYKDKEVKNVIHFSFAKEYFSPLQKLYINIKAIEEVDKTEFLSLEINNKNKESVVSIAKAHREMIRESINIVPLLNYRLFPILSSGHKYMLNSFATMHDKLNTVKDDNILLLLDEIEVFLHPNWQKNFLNLLITFLKVKYKSKKFHIILATHSPFILSDIPKNNIVFLGDKEVETETFGANIHTLLKDGFFMQNGLMGAYAKDKIENVVNFLKNKKSNIQTYEEASAIISIIGEPILRMRLEQMLNEYKEQHKLETKEEIQKKINMLQKQLSER